MSKCNYIPKGIYTHDYIYSGRYGTMEEKKEVDIGKLVNNIFFQNKAFSEIKKGTLRGIYIQSKKRFVKNNNMIRVPATTTLGEHNPNWIHWEAYIEYDKETEDTFILLVVGD